MISHELSTIQQHNQVQEWLQSCPGYVEPDLEGLDSPFRVAYLPAHTWKGKRTLSGSSRGIAKANRDAELAIKIREMAERDKGVTAIGEALRMDGRRVHAIAKKFGITIPDKSVFRKEAV